MKTKIVVVSLFVIFLLMLVPSISAVEFNTVIESNKSSFFEKLGVSNKELKEKLKTRDIEKLRDELKEMNSNSFGFGNILFKLIELFAQVIAYFSIFGILPAIFSFIFYIYLLIF